jgi:hypothetical protein
MNIFPDYNFFDCELTEYIPFTAKHKNIQLCNAAVTDGVAHFSWASLKIISCELWNIIIIIKSTKSFVFKK